MAPGVTRSRNVRSRCRCSMCPAIHINSRSWLRSSSTHEPSDPPHRVVNKPFGPLSGTSVVNKYWFHTTYEMKTRRDAICSSTVCFSPASGTRLHEGLFGLPETTRGRCPKASQQRRGLERTCDERVFARTRSGVHVNDPSAGSPTDTLLRLLRPLPQIICPTSQPNDHGQADHGTHPYRSLTGTIGRSDGRCVQRAGT